MSNNYSYCNSGGAITLFRAIQKRNHESMYKTDKKGSK
jgi:hypothetical protein